MLYYSQPSYVVVDTVYPELHVPFSIGGSCSSIVTIADNGVCSA